MKCIDQLSQRIRLSRVVHHDRHDISSPEVTCVGLVTVQRVGREPFPRRNVCRETLLNSVVIQRWTPLTGKVAAHALFVTAFPLDVHPSYLQLSTLLS